MECLLTAGDVRELFQRTDPFEQLWAHFASTTAPAQESVGRRPACGYCAPGGPGGYLGINCIEDISAQEACLPPLAERWSLLNLPVRRSSKTWKGACAGLASP